MLVFRIVASLVTAAGRRGPHQPTWLARDVHALLAFLPSCEILQDKAMQRDVFSAIPAYLGVLGVRSVRAAFVV